ncbi:hypothetical protein H9I30_09160 [Morganella morganii]|uniref:hypothetical protein n=1 Tax=Morganella morganii TaxID=582 RepID=UPI001651023B|nr:hypothetical protein [Morganella morganii]MBC6658164.1 hypothetical protein [Morganella morganii]MBT0356480.1 hypothetical protein [Morganella morganii subsp. morganii]MBT0435127.1 hypothetical protein [Morganella morganii subsp. morganii]MBT0505154.1 hypothetical protein [Morganella morganii subsp. morganii]QWM12482.1 hypothetical protein IZ182_06650 [Morganella morganii subsp. morganii]
MFDDFFIKTGSSLLISIVVGLTVAFFTAKYALTRFYKEKWWEKKLAAFLEVTEHICKIKRSEDYWLAKAESERYDDSSFQELSPEGEEELRAEYSSGIKELTRISYLSSFTLSQKASILLREYIDEHDKIYPSWWEDEIDNIQASRMSQELINKLLVDILPEAKRELKINS